jgi:hypothetical protein
MHKRNVKSRSIICLAALAAASSAHAQQALFSGVQDGAAVPVGGTFLPTDKQIHWGPARITLGVSYSCQYDDNVFNTSTDRQWDFINTPMLNFGVYLPVTQYSPMQFSFGLGYSFYSRNTQFNRMIMTPRSSLAWTIPLNDVSLTFYDSMAYVGDPLQQPGLSGSGNFTTFQNSIGVRVTWSPSRYVLSAGASYLNYLSTVSQYDYVNHHGPNFLAQAGYKFTDKTQAGLDISVGLNRFTNPMRSNFNSYSFGPYLSWQALDNLKLDVRAGYVLYDFAKPENGAPDGTFNSYYGSLSAEHQLTKNIYQRLTLSREFSPGVSSINSQLSQDSTVIYSPRWKVTDYATLMINASYDFGNNGTVGYGDTYSRWGAGGGMSYSLTDHIDTSLIYQWYSKTSSSATEDYNVNTVTLTAGYRF